MNENFQITRFPNLAGMMRGINMTQIVCQKCLKEKTHGFKFYATSDVGEPLNGASFFVCDECLREERKAK